MRNPFKDFKYKPPQWMPRVGRKSYDHIVTVTAPIKNKKTVFVFTSEPKAKLAMAALEQAKNAEAVEYKAIPKGDKEGWIYE